MWIVVGLGNPGPAYASTRHNLGMRLVEILTARSGSKLRRGRGSFSAARTELEGGRVVLATPGTYMNTSGPAVAALLREHGGEPANVLVACDDFYLPLGRIRMRGGGGDGGHKGLISVTSALGTREFPRLRLGVGEPPADQDGAEWVLRPFEREERAVVDDMLERAANAVEVLVREGLVKAMDLANRWPGEPGRGGESVGTSL